MDYTYKNDGHYNSAGYEKFASFVLPVVDSLLTLEHSATSTNTQPVVIRLPYSVTGRND